MAKGDYVVVLCAGLAAVGAFAVLFVVAGSFLGCGEFSVFFLVYPRIVFVGHE